MSTVVIAIAVFAATVIAQMWSIAFRFSPDIETKAYCERMSFLWSSGAVLIFVGYAIIRFVWFD